MDSQPNKGRSALAAVLATPLQMPHALDASASHVARTVTFNSLDSRFRRRARLIITGDASKSVRHALSHERHLILMADKALFCMGVFYLPFLEWVMLVKPHMFAFWYAASIGTLLLWCAQPDACHLI